MFAWEPLDGPRLDAVWDSFTRDYDFFPSVDDHRFPGIKEPVPSITYRLKEFGSMDPDGANRWGLELMKACVPKGKRIIALDWQHLCWTLDVHLPDAIEDWERRVPLLPNGDYYIFLSPELASGIFGHPWERSMCFWGKPFLAELLRNPPPFVEGVLRENGVAVNR
jgi:hypothetical protein